MFTPPMRFFFLWSFVALTTAATVGITVGGFTTVLILVALGIVTAGLGVMAAVTRDVPAVGPPADGGPPAVASPAAGALPAELRPSVFPLGVAVALGVTVLGLALDWFLAAVGTGAAVVLSALWSMDGVRRRVGALPTDGRTQVAGPPEELLLAPGGRTWLRVVHLLLVVAAAVTAAIALSKNNAAWTLLGLVGLAIAVPLHAAGTWLVSGSAGSRDADDPGPVGDPAMGELVGATADGSVALGGR